MTKEQKDRLDEAIMRRTEAQECVTYAAKKYSRVRAAVTKDSWLQEWHWEQRMFDILNDILPARYKANFENRSCREGASQPGKALDELRRNRNLRNEYVG